MFQVDAFAERVFEGNPAAIVPLDSWPDDALMQAIAVENNLSETAFFVPAGEGFELRWFTPGGEVDLCGHATLASAHVVYERLGWSHPDIRFLTRSGELIVRKSEGALTMDFPAAPPKPVSAPKALLDGLGRGPKEILAAFDYVAVYESQEELTGLRPDFTRLKELDLRGVVATAPGLGAGGAAAHGVQHSPDFVSRCFFPKLRIDEDPVTGSAHCATAPYWSSRLGRTTLRARQLSPRGGSLLCEVRGDRVLLSGTAVDYMTAEITV